MFWGLSALLYICTLHFERLTTLLLPVWECILILSCCLFLSHTVNFLCIIYRFLCYMCQLIRLAILVRSAKFMREFTVVWYSIDPCAKRITSEHHTVWSEYRLLIIHRFQSSRWCQQMVHLPSATRWSLPISVLFSMCSSSGKERVTFNRSLPFRTEHKEKHIIIYLPCMEIHCNYF